MQSLPIAIVGAGIGGLAAAVALRRAGFEARVYERAPAIREVGAGLGLWANAVRVLDSLGVGQTVRAAALPMQTAGIYDETGRPLSVSDIGAFSQKLGTPSFVMHRADLQRILLDALATGVVATGAEYTGHETLPDGRVRVAFRDREPVTADLLIGADGFRSALRRQLWGETPIRYSGQTCYRGVVRLPVARPGLLAEIQGRGQRLGHCPFAADRVYWFACHNAACEEPEDPRGAKTKLLERFRGWPFDLPDLIAATPDEAILRTDLCDRAPLRAWSRGRVTLLGDAAHPMLPNLGQGACTAIEDAAVLARVLASAPTIERALAAYEAERLPRTTRMVELSWRFGRLAHWSHPLAVRAREWALRATPAALLRRELRWQLGYDALHEPC